MQPYQKEAIYRIDAKTGKLHQLSDEIHKPNGLCFSPDYKKVYVADTGASHYDDAKRNIKVWDIIDDGKKLANGKEFASMMMDVETRVRKIVNGREEITYVTEEKGGFADGIRCDEDGNIWASAGWARWTPRRCCARVLASTPPWRAAEARPRWAASRGPAGPHAWPQGARASRRTRPSP